MISGTYYTQTEVKDILSVDRKTIYRWMKKGKIKYEKVGPIVMIPEEEIKRLQAELAG